MKREDDATYSEPTDALSWEAPSSRRVSSRGSGKFHRRTPRAWSNPSFLRLVTPLTWALLLFAVAGFAGGFMLARFLFDAPQEPIAIVLPPNVESSRVSPPPPSILLVSAQRARAPQQTERDDLGLPQG